MWQDAKVLVSFLRFSLPIVAPFSSLGRLTSHTALATRYGLQTTEPNVPICIICSVLPYTVTRTHTYARMSILTHSCTHIDHLSFL